MLSVDALSRIADLQDQVTELATAVIDLYRHLENVCHTVDQLKHAAGTPLPDEPPNSTQPISDYRIAFRQWQLEQRPITELPTVVNHK